MADGPETPSPKPLLSTGRQIWRALFLIAETATVFLMLLNYHPYNRIIFNDSLSLAPLLALPFLAAAMFVLGYRLFGICGIATILFALLAFPTASIVCK